MSKFIALDYTQDVRTLIEEQKDICKNVTHAYFCSYVHKDDFAELNAANAAIFENFLHSLEQVAPKLENVTLQTGGKYYQVHLMPVPSPAREDQPRIHGPIDNFYFPQEDKLANVQKGKKWSWNVIRPEAIVGATSKPNGMNEALTIAIYLLTCRELGTLAPMPTNQRYWEGTDDVSDAGLIADLTIFASTSKHCANQAFVSKPPLERISLTLIRPERYQRRLLLLEIHVAPPRLLLRRRSIHDPSFHQTIPQRR